MKLFFSLCGLIFLTACGADRQFDSKVWQDRTGSTIPDRKAMFNDLHKNYDIAGKNYTGVRDLLGLPDRIDTSGGTSIYYALTEGQAPAKGQKFPDTLMIRFSDSLSVVFFGLTPGAKQ